MSRRGALVATGVLLTILLAACSGAPIDLSKARPYRNDESRDVIYNFTLGVGAYEGQKYFLKGRWDGKFAWVVYDYLNPSSNVRGLRLWVMNRSKEPISITPEQFILVSPTNQRYTYDFDAQWAARVERGNVNALSVSRTFQPDEQGYIDIYFRVGDRNIWEDGWRLGFKSAGLFDFFGDHAYHYVWSHIAYDTEPVNE